MTSKMIRSSKKEITRKICGWRTAQFRPSCFSGFACCSDGNGGSVLEAWRLPPNFSAAAPMFAEIGYDFVAEAPPITTFGAGAQNAPPYLGFVSHRILFQFASRKIFLRVIPFAHG